MTHRAYAWVCVAAFLCVLLLSGCASAKPYHLVGLTCERDQWKASDLREWCTEQSKRAAVVGVR